MIRADRDACVPVFTGLSVRQFRRLVRIVAGWGGEQTGTGRRWSLPLTDRVLLIAVYYRTNLTLRQVALLFGVSKSAAHRVVDRLAQLLALAPATGPERRFRSTIGRSPHRPRTTGTR
ncbi:transposase family protein [Actinomadura bangladeshensis]|uniref:Transposase family protein n=1 Tax=Actinomadura bangladeshensis TaxID=453573 RepID=A0A6L9Q816_9ACTN|nr:transposase family protein [Actinomadura bangladeshensis]NEA23768.1 transposase family protein [Actinomadura bangladeshensis]